MAKRPTFETVGLEEFVGLQEDVQRQKRTGQTIDRNGDRSTQGLWKPRRGLADTGIADGADQIDAVGWGVCGTGDYYVLATAAGDVVAGALPSPVWDQSDV